MSKEQGLILSDKAKEQGLLAICFTKQANSGPEGKQEGEERTEIWILDEFTGESSVTLP